MTVKYKNGKPIKYKYTKKEIKVLQQHSKLLLCGFSPSTIFQWYGDTDGIVSRTKKEWKWNY